MTADPESAARRCGLAQCRADACRQGHARCPCPQECGIPEDDGDVLRDWSVWAVVCVVGGIAAWLLVGWLLAAPGAPLR